VKWNYRAGGALGTALLSVVLAAAEVSAALPAARPGGRTASPFGIQSPNAIQTIDNRRRIDVNNINCWVTNYGSFAWDLFTGDPGLIYPRGTDKAAVFASGLWFGAVVGGQTRTLVAEYSQEYGPGNMPSPGSMVFADPTNPDFKVYKVVRMSSLADTAHLDRSAEELEADPFADPLVHHGWGEYMAGAAPYGAPTRTYRLPDPNSPGDSVDVQGPDVLGDMMLWSVYNDADDANHANDAGNSLPLGIEIQQTTFGFNRQGALGSTIFLKWKIYNKGGQQLDSVFVSMWSDPDLGGAADDLVGCDPPQDLGYTYNSTNNDQIYLGRPPAVGYDFFKGPINVLGDTLRMVSFNKYINGTDPASTLETYRYMNGVNPGDGTALINPVTGLPTKYFHDGDPITGEGWLDSNPADRRHLLTAGPFYMAPGDSQEVVGAVVIGEGNNRLSSISAMRFNDGFAQLAFDEDFDLPSPPSQPVVDVTTDHQTVTLSWDSASRLNYVEPGYTFEGYNVYQGASVSGPWTLIATYDEINQVRVIYDTVFDNETGQIIPAFPVAFGSDAGVRYSHTTTQDAVRGGPLHDATEYFFAVTSYSYGPGEPDGVKVLENAQQVIRVTPQRPAAGTDPGTATAAVAYSRVDTNKPPATDVVTAEIVNPSLVTGDDYRIVFKPTSPPYPQVNGNDVLSSWALVNVTTGDTLLNNQLNRGSGVPNDTGLDDFQVVDGIRWRVTGQYAVALQNIAYINTDATHRRALEGVNFGLGYFNGGADAGSHFFGSTIDPAADPDSFTTVHVIFSQTARSNAYRFVRMQRLDGSAPPAYPDRGYLNRGFVDVPFQAWDVVNNVQLDACYLEKEVVDDAGNRLPDANQLATGDSTWGADDTGDGGREYIFVVRRPYSAGAPNPDIGADRTVFDGTIPVLYTMAPRLRAAGDVIDDGDLIECLWANPATENDVYDISTSSIVRGNASLASGGLDRIRVVPNPYYNHSNYELNQFNRVVRFINLPETCTIRIFNLSGDLVRTLEKVNPTNSILEWDLETRNELPVGSGVYIFHVDAPGVGSTFGRMIVFMEKERLNNF
jgi:hypothetical protein